MKTKVSLFRCAITKVQVKVNVADTSESISQANAKGYKRPFASLAEFLNCICPICKLYLSKLQITCLIFLVFVLTLNLILLQIVPVQIDKCVCPNCKIYLYKSQIVFV